MGRSQRANRAPSRYREDRLGDKHFPGPGSPARGAVINPALKPGDRAGYIYDWAYTWPSGSNSGQTRPPNGSATFGGLTLTNAGLPANGGSITATGSVDEPLQISVLLYADAAGFEGGRGGTVQVLQGATMDDVALAISNMLGSLDSILSSPAGNVANYNLQTAGVIEIAVISIRPGTSAVATDVLEIYLGTAPDGGEHAWLRPDPVCQLGVAADNDVSTATWVPTTWIQDLTGASETDKAWFTAQVQANSSCPTTLDASDPAPPAPLDPGGVDGPNSSPHGVDYWVSRSGGQGTLWYYWVSVDNHPDPDTKRNLVEFLNDDLIDANYRNDVEMRAMLLGWTP